MIPASPGPGRRSLELEIQGQRAAAERLPGFEALGQGLGCPGAGGLLGLLSGSGGQVDETVNPRHSFRADFETPVCLASKRRLVYRAVAANRCRVVLNASPQPRILDTVQQGWAGAWRPSPDSANALLCCIVSTIRRDPRAPRCAVSWWLPGLRHQPFLRLAGRRRIRVAEMV